MRVRLALVLLPALAGGCERLTGEVRIAGVVEISPSLEARAPKTNSTLFIIAQNAGGVPLAVHRIVNPQFPALFVISPHDLLVPGIRSNEVLTIVARLNTHGVLGMAKPGDLEGRSVSSAHPGDIGVTVSLDKALGAAQK